MTSLDTINMLRFSRAEPLTAEDFKGAIYFRHTERLFVRPAPAAYGETLTVQVPGANFTTETKIITCEAGDRIILCLSEGQLQFSRRMSCVEYNNTYNLTGKEVDECEEIFELLRIARFAQDRVIRQPGQVSKEFFLNAGDYAGMGLRSDSNHAFMPIPTVAMSANGRPRIPDWYAACDYTGKFLCQRSHENTGRESR